MGGHYQKEIKVLNAHGQYLCEQRMPEANPTFRTSQNVQKARKHPLYLDINLDSFRCIRPVSFRSVAWINHSKTKKGYEIPFNRHFYVFTPPRLLDEIDAELKQVTDRILEMIGGLSA